MVGAAKRFGHDIHTRSACGLLVPLGIVSGGKSGEGRIRSNKRSAPGILGHIHWRDSGWQVHRRADRHKDLQRATGHEMARRNSVCEGRAVKREHSIES